MKTIFQECIDITKEIAGQEFLYFDSALELKLTPHTIPFNVWAVCVSPKDELFVMDSDEQWHQVDSDSRPLIANLYQRLKMIQVKSRPNEETEAMMQREFEADPFENQNFEKENGL